MPPRARLVVVLAAVLGLAGADLGTVSATADSLQRAFGIGNTATGLLAAVVTLLGGACTLPVGALTDRVDRTRLLAASVLLWAVAMAASTAAQSYLWLVAARAGLGAVTATTGPTIASLTGDYFPAGQRGRIYGMILGGELLGTGLGFVVSGELSAALSWRAAMGWLVPVGLVLAWLVWRLPEPPRGGQSPDGGAARVDVRAHRVARERVAPQRELVLTRHPADRSLWWAVRYVLRVRTNVVIIVVSALGYFFFAGLRSFGMLYATRHYGVDKTVISPLVLVVGLGGLAGVFAGGRLSDALLRRGHLRGRVVVPVVCLIALTPVLGAAIATRSALLALPLFTVAAVLLGAPNPALDAARLDIIHPALWGRAEGVRTVLRSTAETVAPVAFGALATALAGTAAGGLEVAFLIFLAPLLAAGLLALVALRTYPRDVATAAASTAALAGDRPAPETEPA